MQPVQFKGVENEDWFICCKPTPMKTTVLAEAPASCLSTAMEELQADYYSALDRLSGNQRQQIEEAWEFMLKLQQRKTTIDDAATLPSSPSGGGSSKLLFSTLVDVADCVLGKSTFSLADLREAMDVIDVNKDGRIDKFEFDKYMAATMLSTDYTTLMVEVGNPSTLSKQRDGGFVKDAVVKVTFQAVPQDLSEIPGSVNVADDSAVQHEESGPGLLEAVISPKFAEAGCRKSAAGRESAVLQQRCSYVPLAEVFKMYRVHYIKSRLLSGYLQSSPSSTHSQISADISALSHEYGVVRKHPSLSPATSPRQPGGGNRGGSSGSRSQRSSVTFAEALTEEADRSDESSRVNITSRGAGNLNISQVLDRHQVCDEDNSLCSIKTVVDRLDPANDAQELAVHAGHVCSGRFSPASTGTPAVQRSSHSFTHLNAARRLFPPAARSLCQSSSSFIGSEIRKVDAPGKTSSHVRTASSRMSSLLHSGDHAPVAMPRNGGQKADAGNVYAGIGRTSAGVARPFRFGVVPSRYKHSLQAQHPSPLSAPTWKILRSASMTVMRRSLYSGRCSAADPFHSMHFSYETASSLPSDGIQQQHGQLPSSPTSYTASASSLRLQLKNMVSGTGFSTTGGTGRIHPDSEQQSSAASDDESRHYSTSSMDVIAHVQNNNKDENSVELDCHELSKSSITSSSSILFHPAGSDLLITENQLSLAVAIDVDSTASNGCTAGYRTKCDRLQSTFCVANQLDENNVNGGLTRSLQGLRAAASAAVSYSSAPPSSSLLTNSSMKPVVPLMSMTPEQKRALEMRRTTSLRQPLNMRSGSLISSSTPFLLDSMQQQLSSGNPHQLHQLSQDHSVKTSYKQGDGGGDATTQFPVSQQHTSYSTTRRYSDRMISIDARSSYCASLPAPSAGRNNFSAAYSNSKQMMGPSSLRAISSFAGGAHRGGEHKTTRRQSSRLKRCSTLTDDDTHLHLPATTVADPANNNSLLGTSPAYHRPVDERADSFEASNISSLRGMAASQGHTSSREVLKDGRMAVNDDIALLSTVRPLSLPISEEHLDAVVRTQWQDFQAKHLTTVAMKKMATSSVPHPDAASSLKTAAGDAQAATAGRATVAASMTVPGKKDGPPASHHLHVPTGSSSTSAEIASGTNSSKTRLATTPAVAIPGSSHDSGFISQQHNTNRRRHIDAGVKIALLDKYCDSVKSAVSSAQQSVSSLLDRLKVVVSTAGASKKSSSGKKGGILKQTV